MIRVYLDSNIFRYLKGKEEKKYIDLYQGLLQLKHTFLYCYSHAHLLDLKRDLTDKKLDDLSFMETLVDNNYLLHISEEYNTDCYLATPNEAFNELSSEVSFDIIKELNNSFDTMPEIKTLIQTLLNLELPIMSLGDSSKYSDVDLNMLGKLFPIDKKNITVRDILESLSGVFNNFQNDNKFFKEVRGYLIKSIDTQGKQNIDYTNENFNEDLAITPIGKTFIDLLHDSLSQNGTKEVSKFSFHTQAFAILNLLGIDKEKNKKSRFPNTINDAQHSFYGAYCDIVVSDDETFLIKSKIIYNLLNIETKILSVDEFINDLSNLSSCYDTLESTFKNLQGELSLANLISAQSFIETKESSYYYKSNQRFLKLFNRIELIRGEDEQWLYFFYNKRHNYSKFHFYKEMENVVFNLCQSLGVDKDSKGEFTQEDVIELKNSSWTGRTWILKNCYLSLEFDEERNQFQFLFIPIENQPSE